MVENREVMARNITKYMDLNGVRAADVCKALGFKQNTFSDWVNAKTYPRIDAIEKLSKYFGVSKADLVEDGWIPDASILQCIQAQEENVLFETYSTYGYESYKFIKIYYALSEEGRKELMFNIDFIAQKYGVADKIKTPDEAEKWAEDVMFYQGGGNHGES